MGGCAVVFEIVLFDSFTRQLFVSNSHVGRMCARSTIFFSMVLRQIVNKHPTAAEPFFIQSIHLKEPGAKANRSECQS